MKRIVAMTVVGLVVFGISTAVLAADGPATSPATAPAGAPAAGQEKGFEQWSPEQKAFEAKRLTTGQGWAFGLAAVGAGLAVVGGGMGVGRIGAAMLESIARQPEATGSLFAPMIITAAMVEGGMLFGIVISLLAVIK